METQQCAQPAHQPQAGANRTAQVLHIDDCENDLVLAQLACERAKAPFEFVTARSVNEAVTTLRKAQEEGELPDLILLDIVMGGRDGFDVLEFITAQPRLAGIPVIAFTGTDDPCLLAKAHQLGAREILQKTGNLGFAKKLIKMAQGLGI